MRFSVLLAVLLAACSTDDVSQDDTSSVPQPGFELPVVTNAESPIAYPPALFDQGIEGTVILQLFVDDRGTIAHDSSRIAESSGFAELDSAALAGVPALQFAPARRNGIPVATTFLQPVHFRLPDGGQ